MKSSLPGWAVLLRAKYLAGEASTFVLYRNVFDTILVDGLFVDLKAFLIGTLVGDKKKTVVEVSAEFGVQCIKGDAKVGGDGDLLGSLHSLEAHLRTTHGTAVIVPYAETLMPSAESGFVSPEERKVATVFHRWSLDRHLNATDNITFIIVESLAALSQTILSNPKVAAIEVPMPDYASRVEVVRVLAPGLAEAQVCKYADRMSGLKAVQIEGLMRSSAETAMSEGEREKLVLELLGDAPDAASRAKQFAGITAGMTAEQIVKLVEPTKLAPAGDGEEEVLNLIQARKRELIQKECAGLIEFVDTKHGLDAVGGADHLTSELAQVARRMREGDRKLSPMGLLGVGAMGAGKTFVLRAFLHDAGLAAVELKGIRSKWVGSTENNLERVLATVKAMGPIAVLIDEADRSFGNGEGGEGDEGTSSRMKARIKEFMSDTENRGVVMFIFLTNRSDKLDPDMKRPGRLDIKLPFFYAEDGEQRAAVVLAILRRFDASITVDAAELAEACESLTGYSNADLEALTLLALDLKKRSESDTLLVAFARAVQDFIPPQQADMIEFMELLAVSETSRRSLLPARFAQMSVQVIQEKLSAARLRALNR